MISLFFLAIIQGIAEFLPISSSAHLIIFRDVFLIGKNVIAQDIELTFDIALHLGTFFSIVIYFFNDFLNIIKNRKKILINIIIATIPGALIGLFLGDIVECFIRTKYILIAIFLIIMGIIIYITDKYKSEEKDLINISYKDSFFIGIAQIFALIPGFSRSGTTISCARYLKVKREDSSIFSFYLSAPMIFGATILQIVKTDKKILIDNINILIFGVLISFIVGLWTIEFLLKFIKTRNFKIFMWYRLIFGLIILFFILKNI